MIGEQFSNKELLSYHGKNKHGHHLWEWKCLLCESHCGPSSISHMKRSEKCMKGCMAGSANPRWKGHEEISGVFLGQYKWDAERKSRDWKVSAEYLWGKWQRQGGRCALSGVVLAHGKNASIDRIDSSLGYVEGNVQWVHRDINRMKTDLNQSDFINFCKSVADFSAGRI